MEQKNLVPSEFGLQEEQAKTIESAFMPKIIEREALKQVYEGLLTQEISPSLCSEAKSVRLKLVKVRTGIAEIHKTQKAFFLAAGRFVDAWKNKETLPVMQMEENLQAIEEHYDRIEAARIAKLQEERAAEIAKYQEEGAFIPANLGELTDAVYGNYLLGVKTAHEQKIEAERKAAEEESERERVKKLHNERMESLMDYWQFVPEKQKSDNFGIYSGSSWTALQAFLIEEKEKFNAEQQRIKEENERLKKEAEEKEAKFEAERKEREAKEKAEREAHEAALKAEREKAAEAQRLLEAKAEAERKAAAEAAEKAEAELNKGDAEKVKDLIAYLSESKTKFQFKSKKNQKMYSDVCILIDKIITHIEK